MPSCGLFVFAGELPQQPLGEKVDNLRRPGLLVFGVNGDIEDLNDVGIVTRHESLAVSISAPHRATLRRAVNATGVPFA